MSNEARSPATPLPVPLELIERRIYVIRAQKVMLDSDLADLYRVPTKSLNLAVNRNLNRFPADFMFQLSKEEAGGLRLQIETSNVGRGGRRYLPYAFTEHGVAMLSSVLRSERAVQMNIAIIRAFIRLRQLVVTHKELAKRIERIEENQEKHASVLAIVVDDVEQLSKSVRKQFSQLRAPRKRKPRIGFNPVPVPR